MLDKYSVDPEIIVLVIMMGVTAFRSVLTKSPKKGKAPHSSQKNLHSSTNLEGLQLPPTPQEQASPLALPEDSLIQKPLVSEKKSVSSPPLVTPHRQHSLKAELRSKQSLKKAFVTSEVLGTPKGLR